MQRPILISIIILISLGIFYSLFAKLISDDSGAEEWLSDAHWFRDLFYYFWLAKSGLILYHFVSQKKWFIVGSFAVLMLIGFLSDMYQKSFTDAIDGVDTDFQSYLSTMQLIGYLYFIFELIYAAACIAEGSRKFAWLLYFGISYAVINIVLQVMIMMDIYFDYYQLFNILSIVPSIFLLVYFVKLLQPEPIKILQDVTDEREVNMHGHLSTMFRDGHRPVEDGAAFLVERGYDRQRADEFAREIMADVKNKKITGATKDLVFGGLWCVGGSIITVASYSSASDGGGTYVVAYGAIIIGWIQFIRGLSRLM